jgi:hypothetical protein
MIGRSSLCIAALALSVTACYPDRSGDYYSDFASVTTLYDTTATFSNIQTYAMPDTVLYVPRVEGNEVPAVTQSAILSTLRTELNALGWQEIVNPSQTSPADVYLTAYVTTQINVYWTFIWYDYWYWWGYWPGYWTAPSTTWYYPGGWYPYAYETGSLLVGMADARDPQQPGGQRVPLVWTMGVNGVLADASTNIPIATAGIEQAFEQSPYLRGGTSSVSARVRSAVGINGAKR